MSVRYSGKLTGSLERELCAQVEQRFSTWFDAWFVQGKSSLAVALERTADKLFDTQCVTLGEQQTLVLSQEFALLGEPDTKAKLPQLAMAVIGQSDGDAQLLTHIGEKMFADLAQHLSMASAPVSGAKSAQDALVFDSALSLLVSIAGHNLVLHLSDAYLHHFTKSKSVIEEKTIRPLALKHASEGNSVEFELKLDSEQISVGQLMALQVGHVIVLKQQIKEPLALTGGEGKTQLKGYLVKNDQQKAVFITGIGK